MFALIWIPKTFFAHKLFAQFMHNKNKNRNNANWIKFRQKKQWSDRVEWMHHKMKWFLHFQFEKVKRINRRISLVHSNGLSEMNSTEFRVHYSVHFRIIPITGDGGMMDIGEWFRKAELRSNKVIKLWRLWHFDQHHSSSCTLWPRLSPWHPTQSSTK